MKMKVFKFYADWCGPCKMQTQIIKSAGDKITTPIEDVNIDENLMLAQNFKIRSVPTMILVDADENEIKRHVGLLKEAELIEWVKG
jgi:thioredoxin 1